MYLPHFLLFVTNAILTRHRINNKSHELTIRHCERIDGEYNNPINHQYKTKKYPFLIHKRKKTQNVAKNYASISLSFIFVSLLGGFFIICSSGFRYFFRVSSILKNLIRNDFKCFNFLLYLLVK